jgi:ATP-binding cassette, subfamily B, vacuolar membrane transporter HMT1/ACLQ
MYNGTLPWVSNPVAQNILTYTQIAYPIILLPLYIITFTIRSIVTARNDNANTKPQAEQLGPGGKPLPKKTNKPEPTIPTSLDFSRPRKLLFDWLSVGILLTLGGNIAVVIVHALVEREERWWCGQAPTVSSKDE